MEMVRHIKSLQTAAMFALAAALMPAAASAQVVYSQSWESGLDGWTSSGFSGRPIVVGTSNLAASDGLSSLSVTQDGEGFSWNTKLEVGDDPGSPLFQSWQALANVPENLARVRFDIVYRGADIPDTATFLNLSIWLNNRNGFRQIDNLGLLDGASIASNGDFIVPIDVGFNQFSGFGDRIPAADAVLNDFYRIGWAMNGSFGTGNGAVDGGPGNPQPGEATVYYDNFRLEVIPEPTGLALIGVGALGLLRRRRA